MIAVWGLLKTPPSPSPNASKGVFRRAPRRPKYGVCIDLQSILNNPLFFLFFSCAGSAHDYNVWNEIFTLPY